MVHLLECAQSVLDDIAMILSDIGPDLLHLCGFIQQVQVLGVHKQLLGLGLVDALQCATLDVVVDLGGIAFHAVQSDPLLLVFAQALVR